jgi:hypothetical protein
VPAQIWVRVLGGHVDVLRTTEPNRKPHTREKCRPQIDGTEDIDALARLRLFDEQPNRIQLPVIILAAAILSTARFNPLSTQFTDFPPIFGRVRDLDNSWGIAAYYYGLQRVLLG